jgi:hypothetical protein
MTHAPFAQMPKLLPLQRYEPFGEHDAPETGQVLDGLVEVVVEVVVVSVVRVDDVVVVALVVVWVVVLLDEGEPLDNAEYTPEMKPLLAYAWLASHIMIPPKLLNPSE